MIQNNLNSLTVDQLVKKFTEIGIAQDKAEDADNVSLFNRLYREMDAVDQEIRKRGAEARLALLQLCEHPNLQVKLQAAKFAYGASPEIAQKCLQVICDSKIPPQYLDAGMSLQSIADGTSMLD